MFPSESSPHQWIFCLLVVIVVKAFGNVSQTVLGFKVSFTEYVIFPIESVDVNIVSEENIEIYVSGYSEETKIDSSW